VTDEQLVEKFSLLVLDVQAVIAERDHLRMLVKELQALTIDQQVEIGQLKRRLGEV